MKRFLQIILVVCLLFGCPRAVFAVQGPTGDQVYEAMIAMKSAYPEGMRWTNDNYYKWNGGRYNGGYGCAGFAFLLSDAAFGTLPARTVYDITLDDVRIGDILRINNNGHSVIVLEIYEDYVVIAEGNYNRSIHWGRELSAEQVAKADYLMTRYPENSTEKPGYIKPLVGNFSDVYKDWYTPYVQYVYDNQLMTGIKGTRRFQPNANITKAQVAQVLYNMDGQPAVSDTAVFTILTDIYTGEWYADAVAWAYNTGVVTGDINTKKFNPNADVTREQLALMMYRYAAYKEYDVSASGDLSGLKNDWKVSIWALDGVKWAVGEGLISGIEKNGVKDLAPQGNASRAQVAAILQRFCETYPE